MVKAYERPLAIDQEIIKPGTQMEKFDFRFANGASVGLQRPYLRGGEDCVLTHLHPKKSSFAVRLPEERPKTWTDGRNGKLNETQPVIHTALIEPDESRLGVVWRGSAPALRPYLPSEFETMPLRVEWPGKG